MFDKLGLFQMAQGFAQHASMRQAVVSQNIAHADTPGYQAHDIKSFAEIVDEDDAKFEITTTREGHLSAFGDSAASRAHVVMDAVAEPNGNSVSVETEMMKAAEIRQQHDMALAIYKSGMNVLRASLGR